MFSEAITKERIDVPPSLIGAVNTVTGATAGSAIAAVVMGFSTDPVARWMYPDPADYLRWFPSFVRAFAGRAIESRSAYISAGSNGAALWLPPGVHPDDEAIVSVAFGTTSEKIQRDLLPLFEAMGDGHPDEPHWYLPMIGVESHMQGQGIGAALMRHALERVDADRMPAYLESSNPRNISLYRRFGFEVVGTIKIGSAPPLYPMLRKPI